MREGLPNFRTFLEGALCLIFLIGFNLAEGKPDRGIKDPSVQ